MKEAIKQRRLQMLALMIRGVREKTASEEVAKALDQKPLAVKQDWRRRQRWLPDFINEDTKTGLQEIVASMKELVAHAWSVYLNAPPGTSVQVGAYRELRTTIRDMAEIFQSVGIVMKMPEQVEIRNVNTTKLILERYESIETVIRRIEGRSVPADSDEEQISAAQADSQTN